MPTLSNASTLLGHVGLPASEKFRQVICLCEKLHLRGPKTVLEHNWRAAADSGILVSEGTVQPCFRKPSTSWEAVTNDFDLRRIIKPPRNPECTIVYRVGLIGYQLHELLSHQTD